MSAKIVIIACCVASAASLPLVAVEPESAAHYEFQYSVHDPHTGDDKQQQESRAGDSVTGSYSLLQPDGVRRIVHYSADHHNGFNAQVAYEGHPTPAPAHAPVAKLAYHAPIAPLAYHHAPIAQLAYHHAPVYAAAPVAKVAYAAPLAHVSYSSPIISYHH